MRYTAGVVVEDNPFDRLQLTATIPNSDPLFQEKRALLQPAGLATQQTFDLQPGKVPLPLRPPQKGCRAIAREGGPAIG